MCLFGGKKGITANIRQLCRVVSAECSSLSESEISEMLCSLSCAKLFDNPKEKCLEQTCECKHV